MMLKIKKHDFPRFQDQNYSKICLKILGILETPVLSFFLNKRLVFSTSLADSQVSQPKTLTKQWFYCIFHFLGKLTSLTTLSPPHAWSQIPVLLKVALHVCFTVEMGVGRSWGGVTII